MPAQRVAGSTGRLFANNPIYRWQTFGEHGLVLNALLFYNDLPPVPSRTPPTTPQGPGMPVW